MGLSLEEQETHIWIKRDQDQVSIYTSDFFMMRKLDKMVEKFPGWEFIREEHLPGEEVPVGKFYKADRKLISLRGKTRVLSEQQKEEMACRMRSLHRKGSAALSDDEEDDEEQEFDP